MKYIVRKEEYNQVAGWCILAESEINGQKEFVQLYLRISKGDANSTEQDRAKWAASHYGGGEFLWYNDKVRFYLRLTDESPDTEGQEYKFPLPPVKVVIVAPQGMGAVLCAHGFVRTDEGYLKEAPSREKAIELAERWGEPIADASYYIGSHWEYEGEFDAFGHKVEQDCLSITFV